MAAYFCPHCATPVECPAELAGQAVQCPSCGGQFSFANLPPDPAHRIVEIRRVVTTQRTAKVWKAIQAAGGLLVIGGIGLLAAWLFLGWGSAARQAAFVAVPAGFALYLVGRLAGWWFHG